jgi:putative NADPH-quinone reductase
MDRRRILILQGHPDPDACHFGHALASHYVDGARTAGHEVRSVQVARLDFPLLRTKKDWEAGPLPAALVDAQRAIEWAEHIVVFFPLWLGDMPALLKGFLEQVVRPGFAIAGASRGGMGQKLLGGRSARVVVTMGMPALVYRWYFQAHSVALLERNVLGFVGIGPIHRTMIGMVEGMSAEQRKRWLDRLHDLGAQSA